VPPTGASMSDKTLDKLSVALVLIFLAAVVALGVGVPTVIVTALCGTGFAVALFIRTTDKRRERRARDEGGSE
jgi:hypothetical protein